MRYLQFGVTIYNQARATPGFTLIVPNFRNEAYLIGIRGEVLHQWTNLPLRPGTYAYLLKNGNLLWAGRTAEGCPLQAGKGGLLREYDWHGNVPWEYRDDNQHHDFRRCETGNTLYLGWEAMRPEAAARVQGGQPGTEHEGVIYGDYVREVDARGTTVWEWHAQDDLDIERYPLNPLVRRDEFAHANACCPLPNGDVMLSFRRLSTIMIIDRHTRKPRWEAGGEFERLPELAAELARLKVDVFVVAGAPAAHAAKKASSVIPIVMTAVADPVGMGLVASLARPGGSITGLSDFNTGVVAKRLELLREVAPSVSRVAVLLNPSNPSNPPQLKLTQAAAATLAVTLLSFEAKRADEIDCAFAAIKTERSGALIVIGDPLLGSHAKRIVELSTRNRLPAIYWTREFPDAGGLMSYGTNFDDLWRQAATYVDKILKGAKPGDLPVEQPTRFELVINLKTAKALGITIPHSLLLRADEVIDRCDA